MPTYEKKGYSNPQEIQKQLNKLHEIISNVQEMVRDNPGIVQNIPRELQDKSIALEQRLHIVLEDAINNLRPQFNVRNELGAARGQEQNALNPEPKNTTTTTPATPNKTLSLTQTLGNFFSDKLGDLKNINKLIKDKSDANAAFNKTHINTSVNGPTTQQSAELEQVLRDKDNVLASINEHPLYGPSEQKTTTLDIVIFCTLTYIIRGIALYLLDWAFSTSMISTLAEGFFFYIVVYWIIFGLICVIVNTDITADNKGFANPFKAIFFYLNTDINPTMRIWVHLFIQVILLPILMFISDGSTDPEQDTYEKKKSIIFVLSNITLLMWFLNCVIAFRI